MAKNDIDIRKFISDQLSVWPLAAENFRKLKSVEVKHLNIGGLDVAVQYNPSRIHSGAARVDKKSIAERKCFLCGENRPAEQESLSFVGRKGRKYQILLNPFAIFPSHLTIASAKHEPQSIWKHFPDMEDMARDLRGMTVFYNGPCCGASAPDHLHFQACPQGLMPLEREIDRLLGLIDPRLEDGGVPNGTEKVTIPENIRTEIEYVSSVQEAHLYHYKRFTSGVFAFASRTAKSLSKLLYRLLDSVPNAGDESEPRLNLFLWHKNGKYRGMATFRREHRPSVYYLPENERFVISPGCADMAGFVIASRAEDFSRMDNGVLEEVFREVSMEPAQEAETIWKMRRTQGLLSVGIVSAPSISFEIISDGAGLQTVSVREGRLDYNGVLYDELFFEAKTMSTLFSEPSFILHNVQIGKRFHWQREQTQTFAGSLKFIVEKGLVTAVNIVGLEDYLLSVISSEMKSTSSLELLKAHAIISRSWAVNVIRRRRAVHNKEPQPTNVRELLTRLMQDSVAQIGEGQALENGKKAYGICSWQDHSDHSLYDLCADDHCQRYQGLTAAVAANVRRAVDDTWGQVLTYGEEICDTRFSKCCGGRMEIFSSCWQDEDKPYLQSLPDTPGHGNSGRSFCDPSSLGPSLRGRILSAVLNDYDLEEDDFFRWEKTYSAEELENVIGNRLRDSFGIEENPGRILDIQPVRRGPSGRITKLRIEAENYIVEIGKELAIRRILSDSHLRSSNFEIIWKRGGEEMQDGRGGFDTIILRGSGWGHGVGLCQIGAAMMAHQGISHQDILSHYYPNSTISRLKSVAAASPSGPNM